MSPGSEVAVTKALKQKPKPSKSKNDGYLSDRWADSGQVSGFTPNPGPNPDPNPNPNPNPY